MKLTEAIINTVSIISAGVFPEPDKDPVIQIANMVINQGDKVPHIRNVFTLDTCAPIVGSKVLSYKSERELLNVSCHHLGNPSLCWLEEHRHDSGSRVTLLLYSPL